MLRIHFVGDTSEVLAGIIRFSERLNYQIDESGIPVHLISGGDRLEIQGDCTGYRISFSGKAEFFRALALLIDMLKAGNKDISLSEKAHFETCGAMVDVSRDSVLTVETIKDLIERMSLMGLNMLMLYTEDTYKMEKYPWFGYMRGAYSKDELKEIDAYGQKFGVELIPCIQTLGHLGTTLRWPYAAEIKDQRDVLMIDHPKTYEFVEEMLKTTSECFTSRRIHIGMDETVGMGLGKYLLINGYTPAFELFTRHINKVTELTEKYGYKPMIWSDMFFRLGVPQSDYSVDAQVPADAAQKLPENLQMVYWDYCVEDSDVIRTIMDRHNILGREVIYAGGIWTWSRIAINMKKTIATARAQLKVCKEKGLKTVMTTIWDHGDTGGCNIYAGLPGLQIYAEENYCDAVSDEHLADRFHACTGYDLNVFMKLYVDDYSDEDMAAYMDENCICINSSIQHYYNDVLLGLMDKTLSGYDFKSRYEKYLSNLKVLPDQGDMEWMFHWHRLFGEVLVDKCDLTPELIAAYKKNDKQELRDLVKRLEGLLSKYERFHMYNGDVWHKFNKPFGWEGVDMEMGRIETRIKWAIHRLNQYINEEIERIEELEAERLFFFDITKPLMETGHPNTFIAAAVGFG